MKFRLNRQTMILWSSMTVTDVIELLLLCADAAASTQHPDWQIACMLDQRYDLKEW